MSTTPTVISREEAKFFPRLRGFVGAALFLALRRFPRLLQLHRNEHSWTLFRIALAGFGAALVILPMSLWNGWMTAIFGLVLFVVAVLLPPAELESGTDRKARELGAQTVVSGGKYQPGNAAPAQARLFISPEHIWALDGALHPLVVIPVGEISRLRVEPGPSGWTLQVRWGDSKAEFTYDGVFAERFARLAEESILAASPSAANSAPKKKAAGA
jgi:hypothetical protein